MSLSIGSITTDVFSLVDNIPSNVSGTPMNVFVNMALSDLQNNTGLTINSTNIDESYRSFLDNQTAGYTCMRMAGIGDDSSAWSIGELSITKGGDNPMAIQAQKHFVLANESLIRLPKKMSLYRAFG